jgi:hypothetical protein
MNFRFSIEAGLLARGTMRSMLREAARDIEFAYSQARVHVSEDKSLLDSVFHFQAMDLPNEAEMPIKHWYNGLMNKIDNYNNIPNGWGI